MKNLHQPILFILLLIGCTIGQALAQATVRVEGVGIGIWNVSARGTGEQPLHPIGIPPKFEDEPENRPGVQHWWQGSRPVALRELDYATVATDANDTRDNSMDRIVADASTTLIIAVPIDDLDAEGWTRTSTSFNSSLNDFYVYEYDYTTPNKYVDIPYNDEDAPTIVFAERGNLIFDNPPPISDLGEGVIIDRSNDEYNRGDFVVDPDLIILSNGDYIAGEKGRRHISTDQGETWTRLSSGYGVEHASTFEHNGDLYIIGDANGRGAIVKSTDGSKTWSDRVSLNFYIRISPTHVEKSKGRIWVAFSSDFVQNFASASVDSDLMDPDSWIKTSRLDNIGTGNESDMVLDRDGLPVSLPKGGPPVKALSSTEAEVIASGDDFDLPGSGSKYSAKYDPVTDKWWALTSEADLPGEVRNGITLFSSTDLLTWTKERLVMQGASAQFHGFNYPFMQFDGDDIVFVSRTAWENERGQAQRWHDADMLTFHRVKNFRGDTPPATCSVVPYLNINKDGWNSVGSVAVNVGDEVWFGPQSAQFGATGGTWSYTGPNGQTHSGRSWTISDIQANQAGTYTVSNTDQNGCTSSLDFVVNIAGGSESLQGAYYLKNVATGQMLDADSDGAIGLYAPDTSDDKKWNFLPTTGGYVMLDNGRTDRGPIAAKPSAGNPLIYLAERYNANPYVNREWLPIRVSGNVYKFQCRDAERGYMAASASGPINQLDGNATTAQWELISTSSARQAARGTTKGIRIADDAADLLAYPNPASGSFTLELPGVERAQVSIFNMSGQLMLSRQYAGTPLTIEPQNQLKAGFYLIRSVSVNGEVLTKKLLVN